MTELYPYLSELPQPALTEGTLGLQITIRTLAHKDQLFTPGAVVLIGVPEERGFGENGTAKAVEEIRHQLYQCNCMQPAPQIIDAGNLQLGRTVSDTYHGMKIVLSELSARQCLPVILGGSSDLLYGHYMALSEEQWPSNYVWVDSKSQRANTMSEWHTALKNDKKSIFNFTLVGAQVHYPSPPAKFWRSRHFELFRLSECRLDLSETEPSFRDADFTGFSMNAVRFSDSPGSADPVPNGFTGEEICQLSFYAGIGTRLKSFGLFDLIPAQDTHHISGQLAAQIIWYFLEGYAQRVDEKPGKKSGNMKKYLVYLSQEAQELIFYKSLYSERWWMEVPRIKSDKKETPMLISCSPKDYEMACKQEIPDRWWRCFQKLN